MRSPVAISPETLCRRRRWVSDAAAEDGAPKNLSLTAECQIRQNAEGKDLETSSDIQCSPQTAARLKMKGQRTKTVGVFTLTKTQLLEDKSPIVTVFHREITIFHHQTSLHPSITQYPPVAEALSP